MSEALTELREQVVELQTQLAFQEDMLRALDAVVTDQQQRLDRLGQLGERLERQFGELLNRQEGPHGDEPPPHY
jgi:SlyX protein